MTTSIDTLLYVLFLIGRIYENTCYIVLYDPQDNYISLEMLFISSYLFFFFFNLRYVGLTAHNWQK